MRRNPAYSHQAKSQIPEDLRHFFHGVRMKGQYLTSSLDGIDLHTAFQPIFSLAHKRIVGYEALLRPFDHLGTSIRPDKLLTAERTLDELIALDELSRFLHVHNFHNMGDQENWLFLNISPQTIKGRVGQDRSLSRIIEYLGIPARRIVIEVVEQPSLRNVELEDTVRRFKDMGCLIAIDDFGTGHSNFNRIWSLQPDIVKLDRSFLLQASESARVRNVTSGIVSLLHQNGSLVLMEGVENEDQAMIAVESDADFVQGYFFGTPENPADGPVRQFHGFQNLFERYKTASSREEHFFQEEIHQYRAIFLACIEDLKRGIDLKKSTARLLEKPFVVRSYLIGRSGIQIGRTQVASNYTGFHNGRYAPLEDADSADWFRRHYLKRAILHPDQLQVTRPYLSITGAHMCITLSLMFTGPKGDCVLCCDLLTGSNPSDNGKAL